MVLLHVKRNEKNCFLYEIPAAESIDSVIRTLVEIYDMQLRVRRLKEHVSDFLKFGPYKPAADQLEAVPDISEVSLDDQSSNPAHDPADRRVSKEPSLAAPAHILTRTVEDCEKTVSESNIDHKLLASKEHILEALRNVAGALAIVYPQGLPPHDPLLLCLEDREVLEGQASQEVLDPETATLWWAGKQLFRDKKLLDYAGRNEKTKLIVKLAKKGSGPPTREPTVDAQAQKEMMSFLYKKQEELKRLDEIGEDASSSTGAAWADPRGLKKSLMGGDVRLG